jgi:hypothetical protein
MLETLFWIAHGVAAIGWLPLLFGPEHSRTPVDIARWAAFALALSYTILFFVVAPETSVLARDYGLAGVGAFFRTPELQLLGWVHYLAFDLLAGSWIREQGHRDGVPLKVLIPCMLLTLMLGPMGLVAFFAARSVPRQARSEDDVAS